MKKHSGIFKFLAGFVFGIVVILCSLLFVEVDHTIQIFIALINAAVLILIAGYFNKTQDNTKALKEYFISEVSDFRFRYMNYLDDIEKRKLNKKEVIYTNKEFSMQANQLTHVLQREFKINTTIEMLVHKIMTIHSGSSEMVDSSRLDYFDKIRDTDKVSLSSHQNYLVASTKKDLSLILKNIVINIAKA